MNTTFCNRCIMNTAVDPGLDLDGDGICNHCRRYQKLLSSRVVAASERSDRLEDLVYRISQAGKDQKYDCMIGVSGGVDSSYVALQVKRLGLRPLAVHVDNGWNSELAVLNIKKILKELDIDLLLETLDVKEFYDLQQSFLRASTPDADIPTDHAIQATLWRVAREYNVRYIISGMNFATESISVPTWSYGHSDWRYIKDIQRNFGRIRLQRYPHFNFFILGWTTVVRRVRIVSILNYLEFNKTEAVDELVQRLVWEPYSGKHYESIFTRWVQGYYLPRKFGIDKRFGHYSDLINSGQISREHALEAVRSSDYSEELRGNDEALLRTRLDLTEGQLKDIVEAKPRTFRDYRNSYGFVQFLRRTVNYLRQTGLYPK
jgi:N-acetyl sugar amidotransferase